MKSTVQEIIQEVGKQHPRYYEPIVKAYLLVNCCQVNVQDTPLYLFIGSPFSPVCWSRPTMPIYTL